MQNDRSGPEDFMGPVHWLVPVLIGFGAIAFLVVAVLGCLDIVRVFTACTSR